MRLMRAVPATRDLPEGVRTKESHVEGMCHMSTGKQAEYRKMWLFSPS